MAPQHVDITDLASARRALAESGEPSSVCLRTVVDHVVPMWLDEVVTAAAGAGASIVVRVSGRSGAEDAEAAAGREIGIVTALLELGVTDIEGVPPERIRRIQAIADALAAAAPHQVAT